MKKQILSIASIALVAGALVMSGCKKDDITSPTITLVGDSEKTITLGTAYTDEGATANDDRDGDLTTKVTVDVSAVNKDKAGVYTVTYSVTDEAGNEGTAERTVVVKVINSSLAGTWNATETCSPPPSPSPYTITVNAAGGDQVTVSLVDFGKFANPLTVSATLSGQTGLTFTIPSQTVGGVLFAGSGTVQDDGKKITYHYTATDANGTQTCDATLIK